MDDNKIIDLYNSRSEAALRETEKKYSAYLTAVSMNILNNREDCLECVNETYFKAWNAIPPHNPPSLRYFLGKITRELSVDRLRQKFSKRRGGSEYDFSLDELEDCIPQGEGSQTANPVRHAEGKLLAEIIGEYLKKCKKEARQMFILRYYFCDSIKSIADCFGVSESKVKSSLFRTREGLRKHLEKEGWQV